MAYIKAVSAIKPEMARAPTHQTEKPTYNAHLELNMEENEVHKKLIAFCLVGIILFSLVGCNSEDSGGGGQQSGGGTQSPATDSQSPVTGGNNDTPPSVNVQLIAHALLEYGDVYDVDMQTVKVTNSSALGHSISSIYPMFKHLGDMEEDDAKAYVLSVAEAVANLDTWYLYNVYNSSYKPGPEDKTEVLIYEGNLSAGGYNVIYNHPGGYVWRMTADCADSIGEIEQRTDWNTCYYNSEFQQIQNTLTVIEFPLAMDEDIHNFDVEYFARFIQEVTGRNISAELLWSMLVYASDNLMVSENDENFSWRGVTATFGEEGGDRTIIDVDYKVTTSSYNDKVYKTVAITVWDYFI